MKAWAARPSTSPARANGAQKGRSTLLEHDQAIRIHHQYKASLAMSSASPQPCHPPWRAYSAPRTSALAPQATGIPHIHHTRHSFSDLMNLRETKKGPQPPFYEQIARLTGR